jgi:CRISPR system Cascade subunit CasB
LKKEQVERAVAAQIKQILAKDDRAALAKLRRGAGKRPGSMPEIWAYTLGWLREEDKPDECAEHAVHVALTLFAVHRQGTEISGQSGGTLGAAVAKLKATQNEDDAKAVIRRFNTAATAETVEELAVHARSLVQLLRARNIDMDYPKFAGELYRWQFDREAMRLQWGRDFWKEPKKEQQEEE